MKLPRRQFPHLAAGAAALPTVSRINYGRSCGVLRVRGQDVGAMLIAEGLAHP
jgi:hypothetical protein